VRPHRAAGAARCGRRPAIGSAGSSPAARLVSSRLFFSACSVRSARLQDFVLGCSVGLDLVWGVLSGVIWRWGMLLWWGCVHSPPTLVHLLPPDWPLSLSQSHTPKHTRTHAPMHTHTHMHTSNIANARPKAILIAAHSCFSTIRATTVYAGQHVISARYIDTVALLKWRHVKQDEQPTYLAALHSYSLFCSTFRCATEI
jgi:hypothetical protein